MILLTLAQVTRRAKCNMTTAGEAIRKAAVDVVREYVKKVKERGRK